MRTVNPIQNLFEVFHYTCFAIAIKNFFIFFVAKWLC